MTLSKQEFSQIAARHGHPEGFAAMMYENYYLVRLQTARAAGGDFPDGEAREFFENVFANSAPGPEARAALEQLFGSPEPRKRKGLFGKLFRR